MNIWIRNRKQEIAILVALGNSKKNIFGQFLCEVLGIAIPTFALVAVVTTTMRKTLNNIIIQLIGEKDISFVLQMNFYQILFMCIVGTLIIVLAVFIAAYFILKQKPLELLSKAD